MSIIPSLEVYIGTADNPELLPTTATRHRILEAAVDLGLRVLESPEGRNSLVQIATQIVQQRNTPGGRKPPVPHLYNRPLNEMPRWIDLFLQKLRDNFPAILLNHTDADAITIKKDWGTDMNQWDPQVASHLVVNMMIIDNMAHVLHQPPDVAGDNYKRFKFHMTIALAHEMVHLLTCFLTGTERPLTPPRVGLTGFREGQNGEAGRYWESILLGGVVEFFQDHDDPLRERQAGLPYLIQDGRNNVPAQLVSTTYINNFLNGYFSFPVAPSQGAAVTTRSALRGRSTDMTDVRRRARRHMPEYATPPPMSSGQSSISYRRPATDHSHSGSSSTHYRYGSNQAQPSRSRAGTSGSGYGSSHSSGHGNSYGSHSSGYGYRR